MDQCEEIMRFNRLALGTEQAYFERMKRTVVFHA